MDPESNPPELQMPTERLVAPYVGQASVPGLSPGFRGGKIPPNTLEAHDEGDRIRHEMVDLEMSESGKIEPGEVTAQELGRLASEETARRLWLEANPPMRLEPTQEQMEFRKARNAEGQLIRILERAEDVRLVETGPDLYDPLTAPIEEVKAHEIEDGFADLKPGGTKLPSNGAVPHVNYQKKAIRLVFMYVKAHLEKTDTHVTFSEDEVYVTWFAKVLQNWKAMVSTSLPDGMYYEVTYNGDKREAYIDAYKKFDNQVCKD